MQGFSHQLAPDGHPVRLIVLRNPQGCVAQFMDWGATWLSCLVPLATDEGAQEHDLREVLLRSPDLTAHLNQKAYFGATVGRYANRIGNAAYADRVAADAGIVRLTANEGPNTLHGGPCGFDAQRWQVESLNSTKVNFRLTSPDGDQGFPGELAVQVCYELGPDNAITASFTASTNQPTPVNLTNHAYFNLASKHDSVLSHHLQIHGEYFLPVLENGIPDAGLRSVVGTSFDFRAGKEIGLDLLSDQHQRRVDGYDHAFLLDSDVVTERLAVAKLLAPDRRVQLAISTTKPALQVYTGNQLSGTPGAAGQVYAAHAGIALETQFLPDAPNHPEWPHLSCILQPGQQYAHQTTFGFSSFA